MQHSCIVFDCSLQLVSAIFLQFICRRNHIICPMCFPQFGFTVYISTVFLKISSAPYISSMLVAISRGLIILNFFSRNLYAIKSKLSIKLELPDRQGKEI